MNTEKMHYENFIDAPSSELFAIAGRMNDQVGIVHISDNNDRAALAAAVLWRFAERTGLSQDGESVETVLIDFMADMLHLCRQTGLITQERDIFARIMASAAMHVEMDESPDEE